MTFAQWVRATRESLRPSVSQEECARRAGVSQAAWAKYESQVGQPKRVTVKKIADALGVSHTEAMEAAGYQSAPVDIPAEWARLWTSTPTDRRERLMKATRGVQEALSL